ncbi:hypothetical protein Q7P37_000994 [Cladosporium fusiforme]
MSPTSHPSPAFAAISTPAPATAILTPIHHIPQSLPGQTTDPPATAPPVQTVGDSKQSGRNNRNIVWPTPNIMQSNKNAPTTLVTILVTATEITTSSTNEVPPPNNAYNGATSTRTTSTPIGAPVLEHPPGNGSSSTLPDWPPFLTFVLFGCLAMAWLIAAVLYCATFPEMGERLDGFIARIGIGIGVSKGGSGDRNTTPNHLERGIPTTSETNPPSATKATGLGISFDKHASNPVNNNTPPLRKPRSFDAEALELQVLDSNGRKRDGGFTSRSTAPLPFSRDFVSFSPSPTTPRVHASTPGRVRRLDLENGLQSPSLARGSCEVDGRDVRPGDGRSSGRAGAVFESVNAGVAFVAEKLAGMTSDRVLRGGAEEGLLLPVRNAERESAAGLDWE